MAKPLNILIVEDCQDDTDLAVEELRRAGFDPTWKQVETEREFLRQIATSPDIILSDYSMPHFTGLRAAELLKESGLNIPFILISGTVGEDLAVEAMKHGATDYLLKDRITRLGSAVERAMEQKRLRDERARAEASLNLFRALVDRSSDGIDVVDPDTGRFLDVNQTTCERLGYKREELLAMSVSDIEVGGVAFVSWPEFVKELRQAGSKIMEGQQKRKDGSVFSVEVRVRLIKVDREYIIASVRDITDRKRVEERKQRNEEWLRKSAEIQEAILNALPAHIALLDPAGVIIRVNEAWCRVETANRLQGPEFGEGQNYLEICNRAREEYAESGQAALEGIQKVLRGEAEEIAVEYACHLPTEPRWFRLIVTPLRESLMGGAVVMHVNVTERRLAEEAVGKQLDELQRWHETMLGREDRILELKREVNEQLARQRLPARYASTATP